MRSAVAIAVLLLSMLAPSRTAAAERPDPPRGLVVIAHGRATDAAWPLAQAIYGAELLRPAVLDDPTARALCGEPPGEQASAELKDLAAEIASIKGDDAPSRTLLESITRRLAVRGAILVVDEGGQPNARVFLGATAAFDAASYRPDAGSRLTWSGAVQSLTRTFGAVPTAPLTREPTPTAEDSTKRRSFFQSPWFWGALGAAALAGAALYLTHDNGATMLHLQMNIPH